MLIPSVLHIPASIVLPSEEVTARLEGAGMQRSGRLLLCLRVCVSGILTTAS